MKKIGNHSRKNVATTDGTTKQYETYKNSENKVNSEYSRGTFLTRNANGRIET